MILYSINLRSELFISQVDVEEDILSTQMPQVRGVEADPPTHDLLSTQTTAPPPDQERLKVLNQLLAQLEERRVQRQRLFSKAYYVVFV